MYLTTKYQTYSDEELVMLHRAGDTGAGNALLQRHEGYTEFFVRKGFTAEAKEEIRSRLYTAFARMLREYDASRGIPFAKALGRMLNFAFLRYLDECEGRAGREISLPETELLTAEDRDMYHESAAEILGRLTLTDRQRQIAEFLYMNPDLSEAEEARQLGISRAVLQRHKAKIGKSLIKAGYGDAV